MVDEQLRYVIQNGKAQVALVVCSQVDHLKITKYIQYLSNLACGLIQIKSFHFEISSPPVENADVYALNSFYVLNPL